MESELKNVISKEIAWHYRVVPNLISETKVVFLIDKARNNQKIISELEVVIGKEIELIEQDSLVIEKLLILNYRKSGEQPTSIKNNVLDEIIAEAIDFKSSDIHFEIYEEFTRIRYRIDGVLVEKKQLKLDVYAEVINMIKIQSNLDITEKRLPQDGKTKIIEHDIRVSVIPTQFGEKVVMRILGKSANSLDIKVLGFSELELKNYLEAVSKNKGIILISGPTGSGKTTTLYATLKLLNKPEKNIMTIEDPIEYILEGINQTQLNESIGLGFTQALRSFLRQDPDIIMLGEIRDKKTSEMAIRAALTGHLVLSTIHTNSALGTISRLVDMGIPSFLISETINITLAQRLVRKLCSKCKKEVTYNSTDFPKTYQLPVTIEKYYQSVGCADCHYSGYKGRIAIYEMIVIDKDIAEKIREEDNLGLEKLIESRNLKTLSTKAFELLINGTTSILEVYPILLN